MGLVFGVQISRTPPSYLPPDGSLHQFGYGACKALGLMVRKGSLSSSGTLLHVQGGVTL